MRIEDNSSRLPEHVLWVLEEGFFGYLGTCDSAGNTHVTPVTFVFERNRNRIFFLTSKVAKKLRNIRQNNLVSFLVDIRDPTDIRNNRAVLIHGKAKIFSLLDIVKNARRALRIRRSLVRKYPRYAEFYNAMGKALPKPWRSTLFVSRVLVEVQIQRLHYIRQAAPLVLGETIAI